MNFRSSRMPKLRRRPAQNHFRPSLEGELEDRTLMTKVASFIETSPAVAVVGNQTPIIVTPRDASGATIRDYVGYISFTSSDRKAILPPPQNFVDSGNGTETFQVTLETPGVQSIIATAVNGATGSTSDQVNQKVATFVVTSPAVAVPGNSTQVVVTPKDASGATIPDYVGYLTFTSSDPRAILPPPQNFVDSGNGTETFQVTLETPGVQSIISTAVNGATGSTSDQVNQKVATFGMTSPAVAVPGNSTQVVVTPKDASGATIPDYVGYLTFTSSDRKAILPPPQNFVDSGNGTETFQVTLETPGVQSIIATAVNGATGSTSDQVNQKVATFGMTSPAVAVVGNQTPIIVTPKDASGNLIPGYVGYVTFTSSDRKAILPPPQNFVDSGNGTETFQVTLETPGVQSIIATAVNGAKNSVIVDAVSRYISDGNFSSTLISQKSYQYTPFNTPWTFDAGSGITTGNSAFTTGSPVASTSQVAFIQNSGTLSQSIYLTRGKYAITFQATQRTNFQTNYQKIGVYEDGVFLEDVAPSVGTFGIYTTASISVSKTGVHTIFFKGENPLGGDDTAFITDVAINPSSATKSVSTSGDILVTTDGRIFDTRDVNVAVGNTEPDGFIGRIVQSNDLLPHSIGIAFGGAVSRARYPEGGAAASYSVGLALFSQNDGIALGLYTSGGGFSKITSSQDSLLSVPNGVSLGGDTVWGAAISTPSKIPTFTISNATSLNSLKGPFDTTILTAGIGSFGVTLQISVGFDENGDEIYQTSYGFGPGILGIAEEHYLTYTTPIGSVDLPPNPFDPFDLSPMGIDDPVVPAPGDETGGGGFDNDEDSSDDE